MEKKEKKHEQPKKKKNEIGCTSERNVFVFLSRLLFRHT